MRNTESYLPLKFLCLLFYAMNYIKYIKSQIFKILKKDPQPLYKIIGEEKGVFELVKNFYKIMESDPKAKQCLLVHELDKGLVPDIVKKKFFMFLCGWFGGPNLFIQTYGNPRMRARHMHIKITKVEKDQWLYCISNALDIHSCKIKKNDLYRFEGSFKALASRIQNM